MSKIGTKTTIRSTASTNCNTFHMSLLLLGFMMSTMVLIYLGPLSTAISFRINSFTSIFVRRCPVVTHEAYASFRFIIGLNTFITYAAFCTMKCVLLHGLPPSANCLTPILSRLPFFVPLRCPTFLNSGHLLKICVSVILPGLLL